ncbi:LysR family transcriptional regulator [Actinomadura sp. NBRC 104412]|uniref:LysR family transcriptional regulator n=1 Tax=Actinomadura sp. NBRC 104412 TaxID=3032203 RepID=UPI0024A4B73B|nr:LysR family transcriptional regulator [Actinomadura sp. NBRC 104412]GLZ03333.1 LysR family transcriptional regulator [Actinomadura sp. NBRC 104412]
MSECLGRLAPYVELHQLRIFEAVVGHRTVTDAAVALEMAPSSVSAQIRALERSLGVPLFERTAKGMRLTDQGERLRGWSRRLLDQAEQARREITGQAQRLRLGALETLAAVHVPQVLARLSGRRPGIEVQVLPTTRRDDLLADVAAGRLEAALLLDTGDALGELGFPAPPEPLTFADIDTVPLALVAAPGHRLCERPHLSPDDLSGERLLVNGPGCSFHLAADKIFGPDVTRVPAGGVQVMRAWAEQGLGIALLPQFAVSSALRTAALAKLDLDVPALSLRLVWHADRETLPGLRDLLYATAATPA